VIRFLFAAILLAAVLAIAAGPPSSQPAGVVGVRSEAAPTDTDTDTDTPEARAAAALGVADPLQARAAAAMATAPTASEGCDCHKTAKCDCNPGACKCCEEGVPSYAEQMGKAILEKRVLVAYLGGVKGSCHDGALSGQQSQGEPSIVVGYPDRTGKLVQAAVLPAAATKVQVQQAVQVARAKLRGERGHWETRKVCHGTYCTVQTVWVPDPEPASEASPARGLDTPADVQLQLLADLDRLLGQSSWLVGAEQKRLLRAVRAVVEADPAVSEKVHAKLQ
jgi:hypothetical protein